MGRSTRSWLFVGLLALVQPLALPRAEAQDQRQRLAPSAINLHGTAGTEAFSSLLSFGCAYALGGDPLRVDDRVVTCKFAATAITRPNAEQVAERLQKLDAVEPDDGNDGFPGICTALTQVKAQAERRAQNAPHHAYYERLAKACADSDAAAGKEALRFGTTEIWAKTCEALNAGTREYEFQKIDDATWRGADAGHAGGKPTIRTIWRKRDANDSSWNYKQVVSGDPSCNPTPFRQCVQDSLEEWTGDASMTLTGCEYFD
jgi:hypothetical protein